MNHPPFMTTAAGKAAAASTVWLLLGAAAISFAGKGAHFHAMMLIIAFTGICGFVSAALLSAIDYPVETLKLVTVVPLAASLGFPASYILAEGAPLAGALFLAAAAAVGVVYMQGASAEA